MAEKETETAKLVQCHIEVLPPVDGRVVRKMGGGMDCCIELLEYEGQGIAHTKS